jgi:hypothetical protein
VYAVALVPRAEDALLEFVREESPPKHWGVGLEIPLVHDSWFGQLHHFQRVPFLGGAIYEAAKKGIKKRLAPEPPSPRPQPLAAAPTAITARPVRRWIKLPSLPRRPNTATLPVAINADRAERFIARLCQRQSLVRGLAAGLPTAAFLSVLWGFLNGLIGFSLEWLPFLGIGFFVGGTVRAGGKGLDRRFGIAGASLTFLGCLFCHALALECSTGMQARGSGSVFFTPGDPYLWLRLAWAGGHWTDLAAVGLSVWQGYVLAFRRVTPQEMSFLADEGIPR